MNFRDIKSALLVGVCAAAGAFGLAGRAGAQGSEAEQSASQLAEVTVTARRQEESLQKTPVSVTAVTGELLEKLNIQDVTQVAEFTPNLSISHQPSSTTATAITLRGIGQTEPAATAEQAVGLYLDGVYIARTAGAVFDLVDLERVEVLRGPQGTLFGRNTTGGAVQLVSKKPADEFGIEQKLSYGRFNDWFTRTRLDTGFLFGSPVKATLAYLHRERDGYFDNTLAPDDQDPGSFDNDAVWLGLHGQFGDRFTASYSLDWNERSGAPVFFQIVAATPDVMGYYGNSPTFGGAPFQVSAARLDRGQQAPFDGRFTSDAETVGHNLTLEYQLNDATTLKSISSYRSFEQDTICNLTGNGVMRGPVLDPVTFQFAGIQDLNGPYNCHNAPQRQFQYSGELQLLGNTEQWSYVAGVFYFFERASEYNLQRFTFVLPGGGAALNLSPVSSFGGETTSKAAFGQVSYRPAALAGKLELTGGLRYTQDDKEFFSSLFLQPGNASSSNTSGLVSANYQFTDDVMGYARVSTGYKAGGFSPRAPFLAKFDPEKATAYELGLKAEWFDRRLRTNLSLYQTDYKDLQVQQFQSGTGGSVGYTVNAAEATFRGFELEVVAKLSEGLMVDAAYGYTDPKYDRYLFRDPVTDIISDVADVARFSALAKYNWHVGAEYTFAPFSAGRLSARLDWSEQAERYFYPLDSINIFNEQVKDPGTENLRARLALTEMPLGAGTWEVALWGDNLTDHNNVGYGIDFGGLGFGGLHYSEPRRYGIDVKVRF
ncbi:MAG TPA: TonB-dependent receptor [Steroidobacteraceae bacterium]|nr:TonB-dependent receptor [Steroidobacteraceae bacterium]HQZ81108.1 TonB-dependent receptor [Steroidobacteraceae bacterium]